MGWGVASARVDSRHRFGIGAAITLLAGLASVLAASELPAEIVINWDAAGNPGGTIRTTTGLGLLPVVMGILLICFAAIPRIDPLRENIRSFRRAYDWFVVFLTAYLGVIHLGILAFNLGYRFDVTLLVLAGTAFLYYFVGMVLSRAERNWFVGVRTPWTLSDDEVWNRTHDVAAPLFKACGVLAAVGLAFGDYAVYVAFVPVVITALGTVVYSYYLYEQLDDGDPARG